MTTPQDSKGKVAYIVSKFPCYDEAFILREIYAASQRMDIRIISLRKSKDPVIHDQAAKLLPKTVDVPFLISRKFFEAHLRTFFRNPFRYLRVLTGLILHNLKSPEFLLKNLVFFPKAVYLAECLQREGVTHVHAYWATYPASVALLIHELTGIPYSFTGHAHDIYLDTTHLQEKMKHADFISTCTNQNRTYLKGIAPGCADSKICVDYHGLTLEEFSVNGKKRNEVFEILSVGTLHYYKGFNYLIDALRVLKDQGLHFHCTIIGGGPLERDLKKHIRLLDLEALVTMTGALKQSQVIPYYRKADVFVLMAQSEWHWGIPNVMIESYAAKTPVITTRFGSVEELVRDGKTGLLAEAKNSGDLAQKIERLYHDDLLRTRLAEAGHEIVHANFDIEKNIESLVGRFRHESAAALHA